MTTLTLTPDTATGSVRVTVTPTTGTEKITRVQRTDANGTYDVRTVTGQLPYTGPAAIVLDDYEAAAGSHIYTVSTLDGAVAGSASAGGTLTLDTPWLGVPVTPQFSARLSAVTGYGAGVDGLGSVVQPDGRADPVAILRGAGTRTGALELWAQDYPDGLALLRIAQRPAVLMLRQAEHAGMDMFFAAQGAELRPDSTRWKVAIRYVEVARPSGPLAGSLGWTFAALRSSAPTFADVFARYATFGDLRTDTRKP